MTWLAMLAMALIVVMPVLARTLPMASLAGIAGDCPVHQAAHSRHPASPHAPVDPTERCGYCTLLNHSPPLASGAVVHVAPAAPIAAIARSHRIGEKPALPRLSADPRGPPTVA
ncbi:DUF2946 family protein [Dyella flagellata]|uniref:DUF2946 family protein n=1 Tax=Dyella flagellata TaxID=1867833 RepID=UPI00384E4E7E